jgi:hypothetical protein
VNQRRTPFLIGLVAAALLLFRGPTLPTPEPPAAGGSAALPSGDAARGDAAEAPQLKEPADPASARVQASRRQYARLYRDLLGIESPKPPRDKAAAMRLRGSLAAQPLKVEISAEPDEKPVSDPDLREIAATARRVGDRLNFMIALVPDPIDSGLPSDFDLTMSALQSGLAEAGYRLDRQWLPWVEPEDTQARSYRETAGLMLFRRGSRPSREKPWLDELEAGRQLLAVLLVGETLKAGIHKAAFQRAVDFILDLHEQDQSLDGAAALPAYEDAPCPEIPVLGPSSSGSVASLRLALDRERKGTAPCYRIVSGTASAPNLETLMERPLPGNAKVKVRFSRTVIPDDALAEKGLGFLEERLGWDLDRAALLVERDTAYGSYFSGLSPVADRNRRLSHITKVLFPSGLYALRNAWEASGALPAQTVAGNPQAFTPKTALEVSLADQRTPVDVVPEVSPLTARIYDMALADLLRQIASEGYSYIGILATDVKDQLFLAEQVRRWAPGAVLFLIDNNLLYVHPQYNATTFGMLTISSFPLTVEGDQRVVSPASLEPRSRRQFASERQEGTLLAVRSLVSGSPSPNPAGRGVWIAACGNYAIWPLAHLDLERESAPTYPAFQGNLGPSWQSVPLLGPKGLPDRLDWNLAFLAFLACLATYLLGREAFSWAQVQPLTRRLLSGAAAILSLAGAFLVGLWITRLWASFAARGHLTVPAWVFEAWRSWLLLGLLLSGYLYLAYALAGTMGASRWRKWVLAAVSMLLPLAPPLAAFATWRPEAEGLFYMRARAFTGGVSPLVSLAWFGAACFFWLFVELNRQWVRRRHRVPWPLHLHDPVLVGCGSRAERIDTLLQGPLPRDWFSRSATLAVVAPPAFFLATRIQPIAEGRCYGLVFLGLTAVLSFLSAMTFIRFLEGWRLLRAHASITGIEV